MLTPNSVPPHAAGEEGIDGELLDTAECSAYPNEGRCTHVRCILRERNSLAALVKRLSFPAASQAALEKVPEYISQLVAEAREYVRQIPKAKHEVPHMIVWLADRVKELESRDRAQVEAIAAAEALNMNHEGHIAKLDEEIGLLLRDRNAFRSQWLEAAEELRAIYHVR